jgi:GNAT superfamily N-acetyltransferase
MIVREMYVNEFDATVICFSYYRDKAIESIPQIAEEYDENSVIKSIKARASRAEHCWFNAYDGQRVVGFIAGTVIPQPWNHKILSANIDFIFLLESHRNMDNFRLLMKKFEEWARHRGATSITGGDIGIDLERSKTLFEHMGFTPMLLMNKELING